MLEKKIKHKFALGQEVYFINYFDVPSRGTIKDIRISICLNKEGEEVTNIWYFIPICSSNYVSRYEEQIFSTPEGLAKEIVKKLKEEKDDSIKEG